MTTPDPEQQEKLKARTNDILSHILDHDVIHWWTHERNQPMFVDIEVRLGEYAESVTLSLGEPNAEGE